MISLIVWVKTKRLKRPILYILGILLLAMPYPAYTAFSPPQYCTFLQKLFDKCPVVQKPNLTAPQPKKYTSSTKT